MAAFGCDHPRHAVPAEGGVEQIDRLRFDLTYADALVKGRLGSQPRNAHRICIAPKPDGAVGVHKTRQIGHNKVIDLSRAAEARTF